MKDKNSLYISRSHAIFPMLFSIIIMWMTTFCFPTNDLGAAIAFGFLFLSGAWIFFSYLAILLNSSFPLISIRENAITFRKAINRFKENNLIVPVDQIKRIVFEVPHLEFGHHPSVYRTSGKLTIYLKSKLPVPKGFKSEDDGNFHQITYKLTCVASSKTISFFKFFIGWASYQNIQCDIYDPDDPD